MKVGIDMGTASDGASVPLDIEELLATRLLVQGNSGSGKSHLLRRLLEQSAPWVQQCIIDPEGDFVTLADKFGHVVIDGERDRSRTDRHRHPHPPASRFLRAVPRRARYRAADAQRRQLSSTPCSMPIATTGIRCWSSSTRRRCLRRRLPATSPKRRAKLSLGAMTNLMCRGRKRGLAGVIATQRLAKLAKNVAAEASNFLMGRTFLDIDMARAADLLGMDRRQAEMFRDLKRGSLRGARPGSVAPPAAGDDRRCRDLGALHQPEADAAAGSAGRCRGPDLHARPRGTDPADHAPRAAQPRPATDILAELVAPAPGAAAPAEPKAPVAGDAGGRARSAARRPACRNPRKSGRGLPRRCRTVSGFSRPLPHPPRAGRAAVACSAFRRKMAVARSGVDAETAASEIWASALDLSRNVTDDLQGVSCCVAQSAVRRCLALRTR